MALKDLSVETVEKVRKFCRIFRIFLGVILISAGFTTGIYWFYLGVLPLVAGIANFCPLCAISGKCKII